MPLPKRYQPEVYEPALEARWQQQGTYQFDPGDARPIYSIDTPPATVSGNLHLGHVYSYSHPDFMARYFRMRGYNVFYPMGFDDNGLPTERLVEKRQHVTAAQIGREAFIARCLAVSVEAEADYRALWQRLGLSIDWRCTYRTIDDHSRRCSQQSFLDLHRKGLVYRTKAPSIWCPQCGTAIAQAEQEDLERSSELITLPFALPGGPPLLIATTRPELLSACVAVFVHPSDARYSAALGQRARVPLYGQEVPVLADAAADPEKGTGAVMCCTFGDQTDVTWWYSHKLPLIEAVDSHGRMLATADLPGSEGSLAGRPVEEARSAIKAILAEQGLILDRQPVTGAIRVHERCDTPVEYRIASQWFVRVLDQKEKFLELGRQLRWHPEHMHARYQAWVENLNWDWCISRQRYFGVPFPVWYCKTCGEMMLADESDLPVDPLERQPGRPCACGSTEFAPDTDVMDTWATSSLTPQIVTGWLEDPQSFEQLFPLTLRAQAHEIIRTWAFYSIVKSWYHFGRLPWSEILISGWGLAGHGMGKISKSRGGGPLPPLEMIQRYSADAVRYWAASTSTGKDAVISEEKIQAGTRLVTKLWNVARFAELFIGEAVDCPEAAAFTPADRWMLARCRELVERVTAAFDQYEYAAAKAEIEECFWHDLADNYLEMAKLRLYDAGQPGHAGACYTLRQVLITLLKLFAPLLPYITEAIWQALLADQTGEASIHRAGWPQAVEFGGDDSMEQTLAVGSAMLAAASAVRRYKSEHALSLGSELPRLVIATPDLALARALENASVDLTSVTRAQVVTIKSDLPADLTELPVPGDAIRVAIQ